MIDDTEHHVSSPDPSDLSAGPTADVQPTADATDPLTAVLTNDTFATDPQAFDPQAFLPPMDDHSLLGVIVSADALTSFEHTLDQLTTSVDLFDVTPFDFGSDHTS
jgi:hypothetical protein